MPTTASIRINSGTAGLADTDLPLGTVVNLTNNDNTGVVSYEWVILSQPAGDQDDLIPFTTNPIVSEAAAPQFTPTKEGSYLIRLTVNKGLADEATDTTICAVRELLTGDRIPAPQETTEVSDTDGWATAAVTKILQRVTRLSDSGIFVAQNDSGGNLVLGKVVHMNGMTTIGNGDNERPIPTVGLALASDPAKVDGPLGVVVGNRDGENETIEVGDLCRVMVMGGIPSYALGGIAAAGATVYVDDTGTLSLAAGTVVRQVGDVAKALGGNLYDIAISAAANSIPRGSAGGDLTGAYPDPTVGKLRGVELGANMASPIDYNVIRYDQTSSSWVSAKAFLGLAGGDANGSVIGSLKTENGGTGAQLTTVAQGGVVYADTTTSMAVSGVGTSGYLLKSNGTAAPSWLDTVPVLNGGTGRNTALTANGLIFASSTTQMASLSPGTLNYVLLSGGAGSGPSWSQYVPLGSGGTGGTLAAAASYSVIVKAASAQLGATAAPTANQVLRASAASPFAPEFGAVNLASTSAVSGTLPVTNGGTGVTSLTLNGVVYGSASGDVGVTTAASAGAILTGTIAGVPTWKTAGSAGQILTLSNISPGIDVLDWQDFATFFDAQYAGSSTSTNATYSTTGGAYTQIVSTTRSCKKGMVQVTPMPIADGAAFINHITTASNGTYSTVSLKYVVTFPDVPATVQNYIYQFRSPVAHGNNQNTGSIAFPSLTFYTSLEGNHTVSLQATISPSGDTFTANAIALRISQG